MHSARPKQKKTDVHSFYTRPITKVWVDAKKKKPCQTGYSSHCAHCAAASLSGSFSRASGSVAKHLNLEMDGVHDRRCIVIQVVHIQGEHLRILRRGHELNLSAFFSSFTSERLTHAASFLVKMFSNLFIILAAAPSCFFFSSSHLFHRNSLLTFWTVFCWACWITRFFLDADANDLHGVGMDMCHLGVPFNFNQQCIRMKLSSPSSRTSCTHGRDTKKIVSTSYIFG